MYICRNVDNIPVGKYWFVITIAMEKFIVAVKGVVYWFCVTMRSSFIFHIEINWIYNVIKWGDPILWIIITILSDSVEYFVLFFISLYKFFGSFFEVNTCFDRAESLHQNKSTVYRHVNQS